MKKLFFLPLVLLITTAWADGPTGIYIQSRTTRQIPAATLYVDSGTVTDVNTTRLKFADGTTQTTAVTAGAAAGNYWIGTATSALNMQNLYSVHSATMVATSSFSVTGATETHNSVSFINPPSLSAGTRLLQVYVPTDGAPAVVSYPTAITDAAQLGSTETFTAAQTFNSSMTVAGSLYASGSAGTAGQFLTSGGASALPSWTTSSGMNPYATYYAQIDPASVQSGAINVSSATVQNNFRVSDSDSVSDLQFSHSTLPRSGGIGPQVVDSYIYDRQFEHSGVSGGFVVASSTQSSFSSTKPYSAFRLTPPSAGGYGAVGMYVGTETVTTIDRDNIYLWGKYDYSRQLEFYEAGVNGSNFVSLKSPTSLSSDVGFTLPSSDGSSGQFMKTDGSGNLSFGTVSGSGDAVLTATQTWSGINTFQGATTMTGDATISSATFTNLYTDRIAGKTISGSSITINSAGSIGFHSSGHTDILTLGYAGGHGSVVGSDSALSMGSLASTGLSSSLSGGMIMFEASTNGQNYVGFSAPTSRTKNSIFEIQADTDTAGYLYTSVGGAITVQTPSGSSSGPFGQLGATTTVPMNGFALTGLGATTSTNTFTAAGLTSTANINASTNAVKNVTQIAWADGYNGWITKPSTHSAVNADVTIVGSSSFTIPSLQFYMAAGATVSFRCDIGWSSSSTNPGGAKYSVIGPASPQGVRWFLMGGSASATTAQGSQTASAFNTLNGTAMGTASSQTFNVRLFGSIVNGPNAGNVNVQIVLMSAAGTNTLRMGSQIDAWQE